MQGLDQPLLPTTARSSMRFYDMNVFLNEAYRYWSQKGVICTLAREAADLAIALFICAIWLFMTNCIDYSALRMHLSTPQCADGSPNDTPVFARDCYGAESIDVGRMFTMSVIEWVVFGACGFFWCIALLWTCVKVPGLLRMRRYYISALRIDDTLIQTVEWPLVLWRIIDSQEEYAVAPEGTRLNELQIVQMITRKDDFLTALHQENILDTSWNLPLFGKVLFWPMCLQFTVEYALQTVVFDGAGHVAISSENLGEKAMRLRRVFYLLGVVVLCLSPFIFLLRVSLYIFRYVDDWRRRPGTLGARCWDPAARWQLRQYCELDHAFDSRLRRAHRPTTHYVRMFTNELSSIAARVVLVVCGGFVLVSFGLALFVDEAYLLADLVPGYSVAFFIGWSGLAMALASALVPDENRVFEPKARLERAAEFMQYYPDEWRGNEALPVTHEAVARLFPFKLSVFAKEALAVVGTPLMLLMRLAPRSRSIVDFYARTKRRCDLVGDVCSYANFEDGQDVGRARKVELSLVHFQREFPRWNANTPYQQNVLSRQTEVLASLTSSMQD